MHDQRNLRPAHATPRGFTLVEILIVVVILGILAAIVVPQFAGAAGQTRENSLKMNLNRIRIQLEIYREQHNGYPTLANFTTQMTGPTDSAGNTVAYGTPNSWGPYLQEIPINPNTGGNSIGNGAAGSSDWYYDETSGAFHANDSDTTRTY